jgi:hypothetical protein
MSKKTQAFFEQLKEGEPTIGAIQAVKEGIQAVAPGLSLSNILSDIGTELKQMGSHGAHEMAAALFNGSSFVMYPRTGQNGVEQTPEQGPAIEAMKQPEQEQSRGGMEM